MVVGPAVGILLCVMGMAYKKRGEKEVSAKVQTGRQKDDGALCVEALEFSLHLPLKARD